MPYLVVSSYEEEKIIRTFIKHEGVKMRITRFLQWITGVLLLLEVVKDMPMCDCLSFFHGRFQLPIIICCELVFYTLYAVLCSNAHAKTQITFLRSAYLVDVLLALQITLVWSLCRDLTPGDPPYTCTLKGLLAVQSIILFLYSAFKSNIGLNLTSHEGETVLLGAECKRGHFESHDDFFEPCGGYQSYSSARNGPARRNGGLTLHFFDPRGLTAVNEAEQTIQIYDERFEMSFDDVFDHEPYLPPVEHSGKSGYVNQ